MSAVHLSLLVLRSSKMEACRAFYEALGLGFQQEQHGQGPVHHSCDLGGVVLEIYPATADGMAPARLASGAVMPGLRVENLDKVMQRLATLGAPIVSPAKISPWGRRAVVLDPDGRAVELSEPATPVAT